jgi:hypothetical protein
MRNAGQVFVPKGAVGLIPKGDSDLLAGFSVLRTALEQKSRLR